MTLEDLSTNLKKKLLYHRSNFVVLLYSNKPKILHTMADEGDVKSEIKLAFAALDQDGDQTLSKQEIAELIRNLSNQTPSQVQIQRLFDVRIRSLLFSFMRVYWHVDIRSMYLFISHNIFDHLTSQHCSGSKRRLPGKFLSKSSSKRSENGSEIVPKDRRARGVPAYSEKEKQCKAA